MNYFKKILIACLYALSCLLSPVVSAMPSTGTAISPQTDKLLVETNTQDRLASLERELSALHSDVDKAKNSAENSLLYLGLAIAILLAIAFPAYHFAIKRYRSKLAESELTLIQAAMHRMSGKFEEIASSKVAELDLRSTALFNKIEEKHFQYMQITSLKVSGNYDEALEQAGWSGDYVPFLGEPEAYQRILISCLARSQNAQRDVSHLIAWQWSRVLLERSASYRNMEAMVRTGIALKHFDEAVAEYDKYSNALSPAERDKCEPILFVAIRRARKPANYEEYTIRLNDLAQKHRNTADIKTATNFAAFYRDNGQLEDAERLMNYNVQRLTGAEPSEDGWERLFNTYIANCIDQGEPERAVKQAKTLIASSRRPDNVFTCARLAWLLDKENGERKLLFDAIENLFLTSSLPENADGTVKSRALLLLNQGKHSEAVSTIEAAIELARSRNDKWSENNVYYFRSLLAQMFLDHGDAGSAQRAVEVIGHDVANDTIGESQYLMAKACAQKGNEEAVRRHLESAIKVKRKWIMIASHDKVLRDLPVVGELLMRHA